MYIKTKRDGTRRLSIPEIDDPVEFSEKGIARVPEEVGEILIEELEAIELHKREGEDKEDNEKFD